MHKIICGLKNNIFSQVFLIFSGLVLTIVFLVGVGCEKAQTPFSANAVQPTENQIYMNVYHGSSLVPNVLVKAIDPLGNKFSTITDSNGEALFDPIPFYPGSWIVQVPTQPVSICGISAETQGLTFASNSGPQTLSFRNSVGINLNVSGSLLPPNGGFPGLGAVSAIVSTSNDCGTVWVVLITPTFGTIQKWTNAQGSNIDSGVTGTWTVTSDSGEFGFSFQYALGQTPQFFCTVSSSLGSGGSQYIINPSTNNVSWTF